MRKLFKHCLILLAALVAAALFVYCRHDIDGMSAKRERLLSSQSSGELHFGVIWPEKGDAEMRYLDGLNLAIEEFNKDGRSDIKFVPHCRRESNMRGVAWSFIRDYRIAAVLGTFHSGDVRASAPLFDLGGILYLQCGTSPFIMLRGLSTPINISSSDIFHAANMKRIAQSLGLRKIALLYANTEYCEKLKTLFCYEIAEEESIVFSSMVFYEPSSKEFESIYAEINKMDFDGVVFLGYSEDAQRFLRYARWAGCRKPFIGGEDLDSSLFWGKLSQSDLKEVYCSSYDVDFEQTPELKDFATRFEAKYHCKPNTYAVWGYSSATLLKKAAAYANCFSPTLMRQSILYQNFDALGMKFCYTKTGLLKLDLTASKKWLPDSGFASVKELKGTSDDDEIRNYFLE